MSRFWLFAVLGAAIVLFAGGWQATRLAAQGPPSVTVCADINYGGFCMDLTADVVGWVEFAFSGGPALSNNVSSVRLNGPGVVSLFDQPIYGGNCVTLRQSVPDLRASPYNFNDKTASIRFGVACDQANAPFMTLYADVNQGGASLFLFGSVPDLRSAPYSFNDVASSVTVSRGSVWAVYSNINYSGSCETVTETIPVLGGTPVGNDQVSSVRANYTCAGPVANSYVTDVTAVKSSSSSVTCPAGFTKKWRDLNTGVGGDFVFACVQYGTDSSKALQELYVATSTQCFGNDQPVNLDLNSGATDGLGVGFPIYFCKHLQNTIGGSASTRGTSGLFDQYFSTGTKMRDLAFYVSTTMPPCLASCGGVGADAASYLEFAVNVQPLCQNTFSNAWFPVFHWYQRPSGNRSACVPSDASTMNLNAGMTSLEHPNFTWIYACVREGNPVLVPDTAAPQTTAPQAAAPQASTADTTPPTITAVATWVANGCSVFCDTANVPLGGTVTRRGTVTLNWSCTDNQDKSPTVSPKETFTLNGGYVRTGTCTDASGNKSTATFSFKINLK